VVLDHLAQPRWSPFSPRERDVTFAARYGLAAAGHFMIPRLIGLSVAIMWLPLAVLTAIEGTAFGRAVEMTFFSDYLPHGRFLLAVPILLLMDLIVDRRTSRAVDHLRSAGLVAQDDESKLEAALEGVARAWRSSVVRWSMLVLTYLITVTTFAWTRQLDFSSWVQNGDGGPISFAGGWQLFVSAPLARLLVLRALWKLAVWVWLLARLSRLRLQIDPLHPDQRCGLRFLGETQLAFTPLIAALGIQLGCVIAVAVQFQDMTLQSFKLVAVAFVVLSLLLILGPLIVFARHAWLSIERTENAFSSWASLAARHLSGKLVESRHEHVMAQLSTSEISSMTDASALFDRVLATRALPVDTRQVLTVAAIAVASTLLPLLGLLPLADLLRRLAKILL
jgi:hypothetical protein